MGSINCKSFKSSETANDRPNSSGAQSTCAPTTAMDNEYVEGVVCHKDDLAENQMKQFELGDAGKVLVVKSKDGEITALGTKCTHYGAPLASGALSEGRVRCQWHGACFNIKTGDIEDFPGQDSLPCYKVTIAEDGQVKVRAKRAELESNKRTKTMVKRINGDARTFVIIGGGPSGAICAETLRQEGFTGRVVMVCKENYLPYDRVKVSKAMDVKIESMLLRSPDFYSENDIETMVGVEAVKVDTQERQVSLSNGFNIKYDKVYVATGSKSRTLANIEGGNLSNVVTLNNYSDSSITFGKLASDKHLVVLGVSFVGLEAAAYCVSRVAKVTVIGRSDVPLQHVFGREIGAAIMKMFEEKGIEFRMKSGIKKCLGENGVLSSVELVSGEVLKADLAIIGIGSQLYTDFLKTSDVKVGASGAVEVDEYLQTNVPEIYAGGDIVHAPVFAIGNKKATIGHYPLAQYHGRIAALNMCDKKTELRAVPYFWTTLFGKSFRYSGHGKPHDIRIEGSLEEMKFVAFFFDENDNVNGVASCQWDPIVSKYAEHVSAGRQLTRKHLEADPFAWSK